MFVIRERLYAHPVDLIVIFKIKSIKIDYQALMSSCLATRVYFKQCVRERWVVLEIRLLFNMLFVRVCVLLVLCSVCLICRTLSVQEVTMATDAQSNKNVFVKKNCFCYNTGWCQSHLTLEAKCLFKFPEKCLNICVLII